MDDQNQALLELTADIRRAAVIVARDWPAVIDADEAEQEITLTLLSDNYADKVLAMEPDARWSVLKQIGGHIASRYRTDHDYFSGNFFYGTKDVREVLESGALYSQRISTNTERIDLDEGLSLLRSRNSRYAEAIGSRYLLREPAENRQLLLRAVDGLTDAMNNVHRNRGRSHTEGPGTRQAISNATAAALTRRSE